MCSSDLDRPPAVPSLHAPDTRRGGGRVPGTSRPGGPVSPDMRLRSALAAPLLVPLLVALVACGSDPAPPQPHDRLHVVRVYMGVSCPKANSIRCDRVGLAVWLRRRPARLSATIAGRPLRLRRHSDHYEGFLVPAGLIDGPLRVRPDGGRYRWTGAKPVTARVRLTARFPDGRTLRRTLNVGLAAGWG